jgi:hypothetical protein
MLNRPKARHRLSGIVGVLIILPLMLMGCLEEQVAVTIAPSGACSVRKIYIFERSQAEEELEMMDIVEDTGDTETENKKSAEENTSAEEILKKRIRKFFEMHQDREDRQVPTKIEAIRISEEKITLHTIAHYESITEFIHWAQLVQETGYTHLRMEAQAPDKMALVLYREDERLLPYIKSVYEGLVRMQQTAKITWNLPGEIISSPLPYKKGNSTWLELGVGDSAEDSAGHSDAVVRRMMEQDRLTITFKPNGLPLEAPVDTADRKEVDPAVDGPKPLGSDLPIVKAGPGYWAEPVNLRTTQVVSFQSETNGSLIQTSPVPTPQKEEAVIQMRLFAPMTRHLTRHFIAVEPLNITNVVDDQQRKLTIDHIELQGDPEGGNMFLAEAHLGLPEYDATAIAQIQGNVIAVTCAGWTEKRIRIPLTPDDRKFPLAPVLDASTLMFKAHTVNSEQHSITVVLTGRRELGNLSFSLQTPEGENASQGVMQDEISKDQEQWIRTSTIIYSFYRGSGKGPVDLVLKYPRDLKKEKISFSLTDIDLM